MRIRKNPTFFFCIIAIVSAAVYFQPLAYAAFSIPGLSYEERLREIEQLANEERYDEIYRIHLDDIPSFNPFSKDCEALFYYYADACIMTDRFDQAEGYLYSIKTKKRALAYPDRYDFLWAKLFDRRGDVERAFEKYQFFIALYPDHEKASFVYMRLAKLSQIRGEFNRAAGYFQHIIGVYPLSQEAYELKFTNDKDMTGWVVVFESYDNEMDARARIDDLAAQGIETTIHKTWRDGALIYSVIDGDYTRKEYAVSAARTYMDRGMYVTVYPEYPARS